MSSDKPERKPERDAPMEPDLGAAAAAGAVTPGGGAGMRGAGAAGGSSATYASGSADSGEQINDGASRAGVTTGSEDKPTAKPD